MLWGLGLRPEIKLRRTDNDILRPNALVPATKLATGN